VHELICDACFQSFMQSCRWCDVYIFCIDIVVAMYIDEFKCWDCNDMCFIQMSVLKHEIHQEDYFEQRIYVGNF
jgi:hypothetical protein